jgi:hypothetical protein
MTVIAAAGMRNDPGRHYGAAQRDLGHVGLGRYLPLAKQVHLVVVFALPGLAELEALGHQLAEFKSLGASLKLPGTYTRKNPHL